MISIKKYSVLLSLCGLLVGCTKNHNPPYWPSNWHVPNRIITKTVQPHLPSLSLKGSFSIDHNTAVLKAYRKLIKQGIHKSLQSDTLRTVAYDAYAHPLLACSPLHLCVVQLESGERINDIELGDASHWMWARSFVGTPQHGSYQVSVKPKQTQLATDLLITTDKRTYNIGLVSQQGLPSQILTFYYPQETRNALLTDWQKRSAQQNTLIDATATPVTLNQLHFDYQIHGDHPAWRPLQVFDDGNKTFIKMPAMAAHVDLPVLYLYRQHQMQLINYRYQRPYYIIDALFDTAYLISGKGSHRSRVIIRNNHFPV